jgi:dienelactone hydrolase
MGGGFSYWLTKYPVASAELPSFVAAHDLQFRPLLYISLSVPAIFLQGEEDKVVQPNQAEMMVAALKRKQLPFGYLLFAGEQHGFRVASQDVGSLRSSGGPLGHEKRPAEAGLLLGLDVGRGSGDADAAAIGLSDQNFPHCVDAPCRRGRVPGEGARLRPAGRSQLQLYGVEAPVLIAEPIDL